jgi:hypothetical protein
MMSPADDAVDFVLARQILLAIASTTMMIRSTAMPPPGP